jgi:hypothetical protein
MPRMTTYLLLCLLLGSLLLIPTARADDQAFSNLPACKDLGFSTEEDFYTQGPAPEDGNRIISDGDLLSPAHTVCARNRELLAKWDLATDLGLDAVDIVNVEPGLVAFSTELDDPGGRFTAGDLLATNGAAIPNTVLITKFQISRDMGLDGLQFIGSVQGITDFLNRAAEITRAQWLANPGLLYQLLQTFKIDIWISLESSQWQGAVGAPILDGDLLSVADGTVVVHQADLLPLAVPAGLPARGVDFGLDAVAASRNGDIRTLRFSTEILNRKEPAFTDGDVLKKGDGVETPNAALVGPFEPKAKFLGLDALHINFATYTRFDYLPSILRDAR